MKVHDSNNVSATFPLATSLPSPGTSAEHNTLYYKTLERPSTRDKERPRSEARDAHEAIQLLLSIAAGQSPQYLRLHPSQHFL